MWHWIWTSLKGTFKLRHFWSYLPQFSLEWKMFQAIVLEEIKTHILCSLTFFFFENPTLYEIMWKNIVERGRPQITIRRMRIVCCHRVTTQLQLINIIILPHATNTHTGCVIHVSFPLQQWLHERISMLLYTYVASQNIENNFPDFGTPQLRPWLWYPALLCSICNNIFIPTKLFQCCYTVGPIFNKSIYIYIYIYIYRRDLVDGDNIALLIVWFALQKKSDQLEDDSWEGRNMSLREAM